MLKHFTIQFDEEMTKDTVINFDKRIPLTYNFENTPSALIGIVEPSLTEKGIFISGECGHFDPSDFEIGTAYKIIKQNGNVIQEMKLLAVSLIPISV